MFYLRNTNDNGYADVTFAYGQAMAGWLPIAGDWNGPGKALTGGRGLRGGFREHAGARARPISSRLSTRPSPAGPTPAWTPPPWRNSRRSSLSSAICPARIWERLKGTMIYIDSNAAGHGWFVDPTPALDEEFTPSPSNQQLRAIDPRAVDRIDLLTVVEHELGHVAGLGDLDASVDDLMSGLLGTGTRRNASHVDAVLASQ